MKPYKNPEKFVWRCPICFIEKTSGGQGHIRSQASGHMRNEHEIYEFADFYISIGLSIGTMWQEGSITEAQKEALVETKERIK